MSTEVYIGLGGNIGDAVGYLNKALAELGKHPEISEMRCSSFYRTTPVGPIDQEDFVNAVCAFNTTLPITKLHAEMRRIESALGKKPKEKNHPRVIDLDLLFYGEEYRDDEHLHVPHRYWDDRLFVLMPLSELTTEIVVPEEGGSRKVNLADMLKKFPNRHRERVTFLTKPESCKR